MSESAVQNLSESLDLLECTIEAILRSEAEFQMMIAREIGWSATGDAPEPAPRQANALALSSSASIPSL